MLIKECCMLVNDKVDTSNLNLSNYISTENLKANFRGFDIASSLPNCKVTKFQPNDILLSNIRPYFKKGMFCEFEGGCSNDVFCIRNTSDKYLNKYIFYSLTSDNFIKSLVSSCKGTKMPRGDKNVLLNYDLQNISIGEQQHIVNILGSIDEKIENNVLKTLKIKELMQLIFKDFQNKISNINPSQLGDHIAFVKGRKPSDANTNLMNYLTIEGMTSNKYDVVCSDGMILAQENDVLMVMDGASSGTIYSGYTGVVGSTLAKLTSNNVEITTLIEQKLIEMQNKIKELNTGSAIPHTNKEFVQSIRILFSNDQYQNKIVHLLKILKAKILSLRNISIKLNNLKQLYLKKFFN